MASGASDRLIQYNQGRIERVCWKQFIKDLVCFLTGSITGGAGMHGHNHIAAMLTTLSDKETAWSPGCMTTCGRWRGGIRNMYCKSHHHNYSIYLQNWISLFLKVRLFISFFSKELIWYNSLKLFQETEVKKFLSSKSYVKLSLLHG